VLVTSHDNFNQTYSTKGKIVSADTVFCLGRQHSHERYFASGGKNRGVCQFLSGQWAGRFEKE